MVLPGCGIISFCGFDFVVEVSEGDGFAVCGDFGDELFFAGVEAYAFVFRAGVFSFFRVAVVLGAGGRAEVCPAIVETVMVDMVNNIAGRDFYDTAMHVNGGRVFSCGGVALGVKSVAIFSEVPIVFTERFVIFGVNEGKPALCQGYAAERIAAAEAAIEKEKANTRFLQPYRYVESNSDFQASAYLKSEMRISKYETILNDQNPNA
ncbi:MAG: hypothetical protein RQ760_04540 [Sedimentisphaerales bacterium]|nr:hypothetical protein [Sedimentisphaerales bacterium]